MAILFRVVILLHMRTEVTLSWSWVVVLVWFSFFTADCWLIVIGFLEKRKQLDFLWGVICNLLVTFGLLVRDPGTVPPFVVHCWCRKSLFVSLCVLVYSLVYL